MRLDCLLVDRGYFDSREKAQRAVLAGEVRINGRVADKPGMNAAGDGEIAVQQKSRYVSRGGYKLEAALEHFAIDPSDRICLDVGASTGGFTDCLLQRGARHVYAIDVGHGQLDWKIRSDPRVTVREKINARHLTASDFPANISLAVIDVSFISLRLILPRVSEVLKAGNQSRSVTLDPMLALTIIPLIKPQFELGRVEADLGAGVIRDPEARERAVASVESFSRDQLSDWTWLGTIAAPITGMEGNQEFLACLQLSPEPSQK